MSSGAEMSSQIVDSLYDVIPADYDEPWSRETQHACLSKVVELVHTEGLTETLATQVVIGAVTHIQRAK
ncbi:MAG TPA: hypothetical protein VLG13_00195, partial [Patescibacteria group bacterium]|nr:hypothetical protein [Patescibacteria group bacterium]